VVKVTLSFQQVECIGCGIGRVRGLPCPDCGARPDEREFDVHLQKRRSVAPAVGAVLDREPEHGSSVDHRFVIEKWTTVTSWLDSFLDALAAHSDSGGDRVVDLVNELRSISDALDYGRRYRPWLTLWDGVDRVVKALLAVARASTSEPSQPRRRRRRRDGPRPVRTRST